MHAATLPTVPGAAPAPVPIATALQQRPAFPPVSMKPTTSVHCAAAASSPGLHAAGLEPQGRVLRRSGGGPGGGRSRVGWILCLPLTNRRIGLSWTTAAATRADSCQSNTAAIAVRSREEGRSMAWTHGSLYHRGRAFERPALAARRLHSAALAADDTSSMPDVDEGSAGSVDSGRTSVAKDGANSTRGGNSRRQVKRMSAKSGPDADHGAAGAAASRSESAATQTALESQPSENGSGRRGRRRRFVEAAPPKTANAANAAAPSATSDTASAADTVRAAAPTDAKSSVAAVVLPPAKPASAGKAPARSARGPRRRAAEAAPAAADVRDGGEAADVSGVDPPNEGDLGHGGVGLEDPVESDRGGGDDGGGGRIGAAKGAAAAAAGVKKAAPARRRTGAGSEAQRQVAGPWDELKPLEQSAASAAAAAAAREAPAPLPAMAEAGTEGASGVSTASRSRRGRALTGLRTVIGRPGPARCRTPTTAADVSTSESNPTYLLAAAAEAPTPATDADAAYSAAAVVLPAAIVVSAPCNDVAVFPGGSASSDSGGAVVSADRLTAMASSGGKEPEVDKEAPSVVVGVAPGGGGGGGGRAEAPLLEEERRRARLRQLFESVDADEASGARGQLRVMAEAAAAAATAAAAAAAAVAAAAAASSSAQATAAVAAPADAGAAAAAEADPGSTAMPAAAAAGSFGLSGTGGQHAVGGRPSRTGNRWDEQHVDDDFLGMAEFMDCGADYDRAVQQRADGGSPAAGGPATAVGSSAAGASPSPSPSQLQALDAGGRYHLYDLSTGSVLLDEGSSGDEGGHDAPLRLAAAGSGKTTGSGSAGCGGSAAAHPPPGPPAATSAAPAALPPALPPSSPGPSPPQTSEQALPDDLADVGQLPPDVSGNWSYGADVGFGGAGFNTASVYSSGVGKLSNMPAASVAADGGGVPSMHEIDEDELFGFDFSYVAPVAAQPPLQLLAAQSSAPPHQQLQQQLQQPLPPRQQQRPRRLRESPQHAKQRREEYGTLADAADGAAASATPADGSWRQDDFREGEREAAPPSPGPRTPRQPELGNGAGSSWQRRSLGEGERGRNWGRHRGRDGAHGASAAGPGVPEAAGQVRFRRVARGSVPAAAAAAAAAATGAAGGVLASLSEVGAELESEDEATAEGAAPAIAFRRVTRRVAGNGGGEPVRTQEGGSSGDYGALGGDRGNAAVSSASSSSTAGGRSAALFLQELLAPMRGGQQQQQRSRDVISGSSGNSRGVAGGGAVGAAAPDDGAAAGGGGGTSRRSGGYLTPAHAPLAASSLPQQLQPEAGPRPPPTPPPGGWKPQGTSETTLFVKGLDPAQGEERLRDGLAQLFSAAGHIVQIRLPCDARRLPKGIAFVVFGSPEEKARAVSLDGSRLLGRILRVDPQVDRQDRLA